MIAVRCSCGDFSFSLVFSWGPSALLFESSGPSWNLCRGPLFFRPRRKTESAAFEGEFTWQDKRFLGAGKCLQWGFSSKSKTKQRTLQSYRDPAHSPWRTSRAWWGIRSSATRRAARRFSTCLRTHPFAWGAKGCPLSSAAFLFAQWFWLQCLRQPPC